VAIKVTYNPFPPSPLQVHKAVLVDGRTVAIKVQHAPIRARMALDLSYYERLGLLLAWLEPGMPDIKPLLNETLRMHSAEVDFSHEARALAGAAASLAAARATVRIPVPHWHLSTPRVLVMDWMEGLPLSRISGAELRKRGIDPTVLMGRIADAWAIQMFVDGALRCFRELRASRPVQCPNCVTACAIY
jgi:aarF domain-containing kinase